jgi:cob(I)alamin adenosyltransferase
MREMTRKSDIYTRTGDTGATSLVGGKRVKKNDIRIEAYGSVDELNADLGLLATTSALPAEQREVIVTTQHKLFDIGAYLATDNPNGEMTQCRGLRAEHVTRLEEAIDAIDAHLPPLHSFILPAGVKGAAMAHVCRTMCRRCERRVISLADTTYVDPMVVKFINRLSDYLFVLARLINVEAQVEEISWNKDC